MKKILINMGVVFFVALAFASCDKNEPILYSEKIVSFDAKTLAIEENRGSEFPVKMFIAGTEGDGGSELSLELSVEGLTNPAIEGEDFTIDGLSASFDTYYGMDSVMVTPIDNEERDEDKQFMLIISSVSNGYELGSWDTLTVTIADDEHPLALLIGTYSAQVNSYFNGPTTHEITTVPDPEDETRLIISNLVPGGTALDVYGIADLETGILRIPVGQDLVPESNANPAELQGWYGTEGEVVIEEGGFVTGIIDTDDGTISIQDWYGSQITEGTNEGLWFNIIIGGESVWTKAGKSDVNNRTKDLETPKLFK